MRIVFMGSPAFGVPALRWLVETYQVVGVVTQPDRPAGRGRRVLSPPVKSLAVELGVPVLQPFRLRELEATATLQAWQPELIVVAAFGQILRREVLQLPARGCVNLHASLLPRHRGAAPIPAAILAGDTTSGVTLMLMDEGIDTGPILAQEGLQLAEDETSETLTSRLAELARTTAERHLPGYLRGEIQPRPQPQEAATLAPPLRKEDGHLDFNLSAADLARRVRAFTPWPGAFGLWRETPLRIVRARPIQAVQDPGTLPGTVFPFGDTLAVACGMGALVLELVQPAGRRPMTGGDLTRGTPAILGAHLT